ncbi:aminoacylase-1-like [Spodoptera frugiperda]|uniref:N-acyl-aliphatic-L-amino acid amidohydrolase n=1 Tax=Spodoptera frugiperda TaxID=7108 RepID=A0A9R0EET8_SPOFR|nr:aminoacylase-1-like [Spodoptera frugiperda]
MCSKWDNDEVIQRFREYLRIPSVHPDIDYDDCVKFLKKQANDLDLPVVVYELVPKKPVVVITWEGEQPELPSILLNSHMDVVPVYEEHWTHPPFDAVVTEDGFIYGRGTLDMKGIGMMHLEAVRRLKTAGVRLKRTVHVSFVPDEETGSVDGMRVFSESPEFKKLNIGFELDESGPNLDPKEILVFYGERTSRQIVVTCRGDPGHGSLLIPNTAGEKLHYIIDKFMTLRAEEKRKMDNGTWVGDITTINLTQLSGGVQINVLPENVTVSFDIRIAPDVDHDEFDDMISRWCKEAGDGVTFEYVVKNPQVKNTKIDGSVPFWDVMKKVVTDMGYTMKCVICPGATDARHVRRQGIPAINFSPILETPMLLHAHNERIHIDMYKQGIDIIEKVLEAIANVP